MNLTFRPVVEGRKLASWIATLEGKSGAYVIREPGILFAPVLYVGESHTGRLKQTVLRHFQRWTGKTAGPTYPRTKVEVAIIKTSAGSSVEVQNALIEELRPRDNVQGKPGFWG